MKQISRQIGCTSTKTGIVFYKERPSLNRDIEGKWPHPAGPQDLNELINGKDDCYFGTWIQLSSATQTNERGVNGVPFQSPECTHLIKRTNNDTLGQ
jgi:hypothetical protein